MNHEEPSQENGLIEKKPYFGIYKLSCLFLVNLISQILTITLYLTAWNFKLSSEMSTFAVCQATTNLVAISCRFIIILILIKQDKIATYLENLHEIGVDQDYEFKRFIVRHKLCKNIVFSIFVAIELFLGFGHFFTNYSMFDFGKFIYLLILVTYPNVNFFVLREIVEASIHLQVAFKFINSRVNSLISKESINQDLLKSYRRYYSYAVKATRSVENYFRYYVTFFYVQYACYNIFNIVSAFGSTSLDIYWLSHLILDTLLMIYLTINLVSVNLLSRKSLDSLYDISFELDTTELKYENAIFIGQVLFTDVGFTFANLFTINTQFIASMLTLSLTIILALANFLYQ